MASINSSPTVHSHKGHLDRFKKPLRTAISTPINGQWYKGLASNLRRFFIATWLDWLTLVVIGTTTAGVWVAPLTFTRLFPVWAPDDEIYWPELAYPYIEPIFSSVGAGVMSAVIPIATFAIAQFWQQSFVDFSSAVLGLGYSMVTGSAFQVILKKTIGGLRPHFLAVCKPVFPEGITGLGFNGAMYTAEQLCTGDPKRIKNALQSFPSGHAEVAFSGLGYLAIYLFTHLRITSLTRRRGSHWRMLFVIAPLLLATYLTCTLVLGYHHHTGDVFCGAFIGWFMAFLGYRMVFKGVLNAKCNTVPYLNLSTGGQEKQIEPDGADDIDLCISGLPRQESNSVPRPWQSRQTPGETASPV